MKTILRTLLIAFLALPLCSCSVTYNLATQQEELTFITPEKEERIGRNLSSQVEEKFPLEPDILVQNRVKEIGKKLAGVCDYRSISYHFAVLTSEEDMVNAFALPGGYVYVFKDLIDKVESDDELAAVIAHEIAHVTARHSVKRMQASLGDTFLRLALAASDIDNATRARANEALNQLMLSYSREDEIQADRLGIKYSGLAGYNPEGAVRFLERLMEIQRKAPIKRYFRYRTHPYLSERIAITREAVYGRMEFRDYINRRDESLNIK